ncbi:c-type cytochrome [Roseicyclus persicicus]|uniref:C-type cytochrome n=1 Tax=Roseicyclus persicicus TaxID=2650661 RepID=A0A7X6H1R3_9RHOB|nr:c-type cytochrome [Roseibacterium persicicum]NKX45739.1 c-type cytochrome [Roseibacterium persicicum]
MSRARAVTGALAFAALAAATSPALAEGDPARGETLFRPCRACHMVGEGAVHRVGPHLNGLVGRAIGAVAGYDFSDDLVEAGVDGLVWDEATLDRFLAGPREYFPGTAMVFRGIRSAEDRAHLVAYLREAGGPADGVAAAADTAAVDPEIAAILQIAGDVAYGEYLSNECTACHRAEGGEDIPTIRGLAPSVFVAGLVAYRNGSREHQVMNMVTRRLGDEEIAALAAYFQSAE